MKSITDMLQKGNEIRWTPEAKESFSRIKTTITQAHELISPNFGKAFLMYSFASENTIASVLLQKNEEGFEQPIDFYSKTLRDEPLRNNIMEKQDFALIKALKYFRVQILHSHKIFYVPSITVKDILTQPDPEGRRAKWITILLEYDLEIKHAKLIKGQGLEKLMAQSGVDDVDIKFMDVTTVSE